MPNLEELQDSLDKSINNLTPEEAKKFLEDKRSQALLQTALDDLKQSFSEVESYEKALIHLKTLKELLDEIRGNDSV